MEKDKKAEIEQIFWNNITRIRTPFSTSIYGNRYGSTIYRKNNIEDYRKAIEELQKIGEAELT